MSEVAQLADHLFDSGDVLLDRSLALRVVGGPMHGVHAHVSQLGVPLLAITRPVVQVYLSLAPHCVDDCLELIERLL